MSDGSAALQQNVADAVAAQTPLRIVGSGTWQDAGRPVHADRSISTVNHAGVIEYVPGDLVLTVRSGTTLAEISSVTAEHGQWLAVDPTGSEGSTIGATIATASSGALALGSGTVRDLVLGLNIIAGTGIAIKTGGRVVKNVAGFDLVRLSTGAWGTLGVITDVSLRLHAKPAVDQTFVIAHHDVHTLLATVAACGHDALALHALEILNAAGATALLAHVIPDDPISNWNGRWMLMARATGNKAAVQAQRGTLARHAASMGAQVTDAPTSLWRALRTIDDCGALPSTTLRVSGPPGEIAKTVSTAIAAFAPTSHANIRLCVSPLRGVVRVIIVPNATDPADSEQVKPFENWIVNAIVLLQQRTRHMIGERLPAIVWSRISPTATDTISTRIRSAFDPDRLMNRGIFGEHSS